MNNAIRKYKRRERERERGAEGDTIKDSRDDVRVRVEYDLSGSRPVVHNLHKELQQAAMISMISACC